MLINLSFLYIFSLRYLDHFHLDRITIPAKVMYGEQDDKAYSHSAQFIFDHIASEDKELNSFERSGHLMTYGEGREALEQAIVEFFNDNE